MKTTFFVGVLGSNHVFAHFEDPADCCPDPSHECLRHLPPTVTSANEFVAMCGANAVLFEHPAR
jgi:hypothetical protein